jgi:hypothetical protein
MLPVTFMDPTVRRFLRHIALVLMRELQLGESEYVVEAVFAALSMLFVRAVLSADVNLADAHGHRGYHRRSSPCALVPRLLPNRPGDRVEYRM